MTEEDIQRAELIVSMAMGYYEQNTAIGEEDYEDSAKEREHVEKIFAEFRKLREEPYIQKQQALMIAEQNGEIEQLTLERDTYAELAANTCVIEKVNEVLGQQTLTSVANYQKLEKASKWAYQNGYNHNFEYGRPGM